MPSCRPAAPAFRPFLLVFCLTDHPRRAKWPVSQNKIGLLLGILCSGITSTDRDSSFILPLTARLIKIFDTFILFRKMNKMRCVFWCFLLVWSSEQRKERLRPHIYASTSLELDRRHTQGRRSNRSWGVMTPHFSRQRGTGGIIH